MNFLIYTLPAFDQSEDRYAFYKLKKSYVFLFYDFA